LISPNGTLIGSAFRKLRGHATSGGGNTCVFFPKRLSSKTCPSRSPSALPPSALELRTINSLFPCPIKTNRPPGKHKNSGKFLGGGGA